MGCTDLGIPQLSIKICKKTDIRVNMPIDWEVLRFTHEIKQK